MDHLAAWLTENNLEIYVPKFKEYGWDDKLLLFEMADSDIELCIQKPGHRARFKKALRREMVNPSVTTQTDMEMELIQEKEQTKLADRIAALISADLNITKRISVAVEQAQSCTSDNETITLAARLESDSDNTSIGTSSTVDESEEPVSGKVSLKLNSDEITAENVASKSDPNHGYMCSDNNELFTGNETVLQQPLNSLQGERKVFAEEPSLERPETAGQSAAMSSDIIICSDRDEGNRCDTELVSKIICDVEMTQTLMNEPQTS